MFVYTSLKKRISKKFSESDLLTEKSELIDLTMSEQLKAIEEVVKSIENTTELVMENAESAVSLRKGSLELIKIAGSLSSEFSHKEEMEDSYSL